MRRMRWVRTIITVVIAVAGLTLVGTRATADTTAGLTVITSPDPSVSGSVAYIYSPVALTAAPRVVVRGPWTRWSGVATFEKSASPGQWWDAALPGRVPGIYHVTVTAPGSGGTSSYEVTGGGAPWRGWRAAGPALDGGLMAVDPSRAGSVYLASALASEVFAAHGGSWRMERTLPVAGGYPTALLTA